MEPDGALAELRRLRQRILDDPEGTSSHAAQFAELFDALDGSISAGGALPQEWGARGSDVEGRERLPP